MAKHQPQKNKRRFGVAALLVTAASAALSSQLVAVGAAADSTAPKNTSAPTISGTPQKGQTLTAFHGSFSGSDPISFVYQWKRCDRSGHNCFDAGGTTTQRTYRVVQADVGNTLRVHVTATNKDGSDSATSAATEVVRSVAAPLPAVVNGCPTGTGTIDISKLTLPARLVIDGQQASPTVVRRSTSDLVLRFHLSACNGRSVQGALVYATAVPFEQFTVPPEAVSGPDGWATLTLHKASRFPASSQQQLLAVFVRARKDGEPLVGGVSTRLLVSFPVSL